MAATFLPASTEAVPGFRQLGLADAGLVEQILAIEERARADVGRHRGELAEAAHRLGMGEARELLLVLQAAVRRHAEVLEAAGFGKLADETDFNRHHVRQVGAGSANAVVIAVW